MAWMWKKLWTEVTDVKKQKRLSGEFRWGVFAAVGLVMFLLLMNRIFTNVSIRDAETAGEDTVSYVKERLETYENYQANDRTKSLVRLLDKTREFVRDLGEDDVTTERMSEYIKEQRLDGILILDQNLQVVEQVVSGEETDQNHRLDWGKALQNDTLTKIIRCKKKVYMTRTKTKDGSYDLAVVARKNRSEVVIAYIRQETITDGVNDMTLDSNFENIMLAYQGLLVITDEENTVAANNLKLCEKKAEDWKNMYESGRRIHGDGNGKLRKVVYQGKQWYMWADNYKNNQIYVLFSVWEILLPYYRIVLGLVILYLMLFGSGFWLSRRIERRCFRNPADMSREDEKDEKEQKSLRKYRMENSDLEQVSFSLRSLLEKLNEMIRIQCEGKNITYRVKEPEILHDRLIGCPIYFQQILMNLAGNAVKYNVENGTVTVGCREISCDGNKAEFELTCADTGIGMSETLQKQVFGSFLRKSEVENTEESRYAGAGQGLSMAGELLGLLGGTMELESKEGEGSKFTLRISFRIDPVFENKVSKQNIQTR